ncbi:MAG: aminodeoxychorismate synthase component I [Campylobacterales bacterium]|nr:aminodeoxychorismate synthase component I [Campylobacterales bacterium]
MPYYKHLEGIKTLNNLGACKIPFLFIISYDKQNIFASSLDELDNDILYKLGSMRNYLPVKLSKPYYLKRDLIDFKQYKKAFDQVIEEIRAGNTYLLNLTFRTPIETDLSLYEIFSVSKAEYKLYFKDKFICFSPEKFISIEDNTISTYPMKGTIDASLPNAAKQILANEKEMAEHTMIVDLMRNDLGMVANDIKVEKFRYIDSIKAGDEKLLQVSSHITGKLLSDWHSQIGNILDSLTPAGSISGTPKKSTIDIIRKIENYDREWYTGVFGIYDGKSLRSAVIIRYIEKENGKLYYKSGGGITLDSNCASEYEEMARKIYFPF